MTIGSITLSTLTQRIASVNVTFLLLVAYHLSCNPPSISIWLAVFSPSASGRCTGGIFSQSGRTHNFHHICCLAALTALKPGLIIIIMTLSPPRPLQTSPGPPVSISKHCYLGSSCYIYQTFTCYTWSQLCHVDCENTTRIHLFYIAAVVINSEIDIVMFSRIVGQICCLV